MPYSVYDTRHDEIITAETLLEPAREKTPDLIPQVMRHLTEIGPVETLTLAEGDAPITVLLDCSGSMRGRPIARSAAALLAVGDALHAQGRPFELLGHTTRSWKGGAPAKAFSMALAAGTEFGAPGRLCELRHIILKDMDAAWPEVRENVCALLIEGLLKENIDGEAVEWAVSRMEARDVTGGLVIVSDGAPVDDATLSRNPANFLEGHLRQVLGAVRMRGVPAEAVVLVSEHGTRKAQTRWTDLYPDAISADMYGDLPAPDSGDIDGVTQALAQAVDLLSPEMEVAPQP